ncbi:hypothetical protein AMJ82_08950 [candidate division TA06 bacterium SM23_40]|uniref:Sulfotransferase domain-containing protein n=1 Tax=candidate division TA06 bacterium SM23_40 TaxID=1703774 RepID=A0A0S8G7G0_UNCT6|nr:MAG: hypothetical protein AMJ82_08950 [candidate division TA06 bacterium SM23_40]
MKTRPNHIIVGLGSGRCGTKSLAAILGLPHEAVALPWEHDERLFRAAMSKLSRTGGDVGCYWLTYAERVLETFPDTRFICLKRPRKETVASWVRRFAGAETFDLFVMHLDDEARIHAPRMFPDYGDRPIAEAAGLYWDEYYEKAEKLQERYQQCFRIFSMSPVLNEPMAQAEMLRFVGSKQATWTNFHKNKGTVKDPLLGNILRDVLGYLIRNEKVYAGTRATVTPKAGSQLGRAAVKRGISQQETDPILLDFGKLSEHRARPFDFDMIAQNPRQGVIQHA